MASVKVLFGGQEVKIYRLDRPEVTVGRDEGADIQIDNLGISRNHCQLARGPNGFLVRDLQSSNGTYVNGKRITEHQLSTNDQILIGKYTLVFLDDDAEPQHAQSTGTGAPAPAAAMPDPGGMEQMHTYVMDGAAIRERLLSESGGAPGGEPGGAPRQSVAAPGGGNAMVIVAIAIIVVILIVLGVLVFLLMSDSGGPPVPPGVPPALPTTTAPPAS